MKLKFFLIYLLAGAAFIGVSLWVVLSRGKSARAIRTKYRLGGILLTTGAFLSAMSCDTSGIKDSGTDEGGDDGGMVMCYDPVIEEENVVQFTIRHGSSSSANNELAPGDVIFILFQNATMSHYALVVRAMDQDITVLQRTALDLGDAKYLEVEVPLSEEITYKGQAVLEVTGGEGEAAEDQTTVGAMNVTII